MLNSCSRDITPIQQTTFEDDPYSFYLSRKWDGAILIKQTVTMGVSSFLPTASVQFQKEPIPGSELIEIEDLKIGDIALYKSKANAYSSSKVDAVEKDYLLKKFEGRKLPVQYKGNDKFGFIPFSDSVYLPKPIILSRDDAPNAFNKFKIGEDLIIRWKRDEQLDSIFISYPYEIKNNTILYKKELIKDPGQLKISSDFTSKLSSNSLIEIEVIRGDYKLNNVNGKLIIVAGISKCSLKLRPMMN